MSTIKIRTKSLDTACLLRILITHPMETGRKRDANTGEMLPAHFIQAVTIQHNGQTVATCRFGTGVSRDPYLSVKLREAQSGDSIKVSWTDNLGQSDSEEVRIP